MSKFRDMGKPVYVERDGGYSKLESISPENRKKAKERVNDPNRKSSKEFLKELFAEIGIVVNPEKMTYWYQYVE